ncbi:MAG TPA: Hpt domain-containing protein [Burkholderiales bacterium]|nr:Hpt domain-containing protein [Burkholderiales bacterium]
MTCRILNQDLIAEIRRIEQASGQHGIFANCVRNLDSTIAAFGTAFAACVARGDKKGATLAAHTLKGSCRQLGAQALGDVFADIERCANEADYAEAQRTFEHSARLIAESLEALKQA